MRSPTDPWTMNSGYATHIAVESPFMRDYYLRSGLPVEKMVVTGFLSLDDLAFQMGHRSQDRLNLANAMGLDLQKPWVLFAVPPDQAPRGPGGFDSYADFLKQVFSELKKHSEFETVVRFHPRTEASEVEEWKRNYGLHVFTEDTAQIIPLVDLYLASVSATIRWAMACGIKVLNYDIFDYGYGDFSEYPQVFTFTTFEQLKAELKSFGECFRIDNRKSNFHKPESSYYGALDGSAGQRILELCRLGVSPEKSNRRRVLFVVNEVAHYSEVKKILFSKLVSQSIEGQILFDRSGYDPYKMFQFQIADCEQCGSKYHVIPSTRFEVAKGNFDRLLEMISESRKLRFLPFVKLIAKGLRNILGTLRTARCLREKIKYLSEFYKENDISTIVLCEENVLMDTFLYEAAADQRRVVVYPYTIPNPLEMMGGAYRWYPYGNAKGFLTRITWGRWSRRFGDRVYLLLPPNRILAYFLLGYFPKNPWILNSDTAEVVCVESIKMAQIYEKLGVSRSRMSIVGSLNDDILAETLGERALKLEILLRKYNLPIEKPLIVVGFPPNQFPVGTAEQSSYLEIVDDYVAALSTYSEQFNIIISKHPRITDPLEAIKKAGFIIASEPTIELVPLAYLYIASASATIRWAVAAGVPVVNYDVYRLDYGDYESLEAVRLVRSKDEFNATLRSLLLVRENYQNLRQLQLEESSLWGNLDGFSAQRFVNQVLGIESERER